MLQSLFRRRRETYPVVLRVTDAAGRPADRVQTSETWLPSGRTGSSTRYAASGLCLVPWLGEEERLSLRVCVDGACTEIIVERDRGDAGRVHELRLRG